MFHEDIRSVNEALVTMADLDQMDTAGSVTVIYGRNASVPTYIVKNERLGITVEGLSLRYLLDALEVKIEMVGAK